MKIGGIQKFSTSDYPGVASFVVFTPGCNFDCWYCYNRKTLLTKNVDEYDENEVLEMISKRKKLLQGVVISGGECTLQKDLIDFIYNSPTAFHAVSTSKELLDTNGFTELDSRKVWNLQVGGKYYVTKNSSAIIGNGLRSLSQAVSSIFSFAIGCSTNKQFRSANQ